MKLCTSRGTPIQMNSYKDRQGQLTLPWEVKDKAPLQFIPVITHWQFLTGSLPSTGHPEGNQGVQTHWR